MRLISVKRSICLILGGFCWFTAQPGGAYELQNIHLAHMTEGKACLSHRTIGWEEKLTHRPYKKDFWAVLVGLTPGQKVELQVSKQVEQRYVRVHQETFTAIDRDHVVDFSDELKPMPPGKDMQRESYVLSMVDKTSGQSWSRAGSFVRYRSGALVFSGDERSLDCHMTSKPIPISGILRNYSTDNIRTIHFEEVVKSEHDITFSERENSFSLSTSCNDLFPGCSRLSALSFGGGASTLFFGFGFLNKEGHSSVRLKIKRGPVFSHTWTLGPQESGIVYKQYHIRRTEAPIFALDNCGKPEQVAERPVEVVHWSYNLVKFSRDGSEEVDLSGMPLINTCGESL